MPPRSPPRDSAVAPRRRRSTGLSNTSDFSSGSSGNGQNATHSSIGKAPSSLVVPAHAKKGELPYSRSPELRVSHKMAERERRKQMKDLFDDLRDRIPVERGPKTSKWEILSKAVDHINQLAADKAELLRENDVLRHQLGAAAPRQPPLAGGPEAYAPTRTTSGLAPSRLHPLPICTPFLPRNSSSSNSISLRLLATTSATSMACIRDNTRCLLPTCTPHIPHGIGICISEL